MWSTNPAASSSTMRHRHSSSSGPVSSRLTSSFPSLGESVHGKISQDHVQAFLARYKLVICMNLCVLFFLCGFSGLFGGGSSSGSGAAATRRGSSAVPLSKSYSSYMDHYSSSSPHKRNNKGMLSSSVSNGRLRGVVGDEAPTSKENIAPLSSAPVVLSHPPPRFAPGTLPQQSAPVALPPVASATAAATATATATSAATPNPAQPEAEVEMKPKPQATNKKNNFLNAPSSSTKGKKEEQVPEAIFKPGQSEVLPPAMVEEIKKEKEMQEMRMQGGATEQVAAVEDVVQCPLSKDAEDGKALTDASVEEVVVQKGQEETTMLPPAAVVENIPRPGDTPLCPLTPPPPSESELETMVAAENTATRAATTEMDLTAPGVSSNSDLAQDLPVVEDPALDVETAASASASTPMLEEIEPMAHPAAAQPCQHRHPVDYIPSFAFEYIYCSAPVPK